MHTKFAAVVLGALLIGSLPAAAARCLEYGSNRLTGRLVQQTHAGPPDYRSVTGGDRPVVVWVLLLDDFLCVSDPESRYPREYYESEVQVLLQQHQDSQYGKLLGKKVIVIGELRHGHADYKRLVIVPREIVRRQTAEKY